MTLCPVSAPSIGERDTAAGLGGGEESGHLGFGETMIETQRRAGLGGSEPRKGPPAEKLSRKHPRCYRAEFTPPHCSVTLLSPPHPTPPHP